MATHDELVRRACRWLRNSAVTEDGERVYHVKCGVVLSELATSASEVPDAIGWYNCGMCSILIEVKTSRGDFLSDAKKWFRRRPQQGMGNERYFLTPVGLLSVDDLPNDWGLLEVDGRKVNVIRLARHQKSHKRGEIRMFWSELRRGQQSR